MIRNHELFRQAQQAEEKKLLEASLPKVSLNEQQKLAKRKEKTTDVVISSLVFLIGFTVCKLALDKLNF